MSAAPKIVGVDTSGWLLAGDSGAGGYFTVAPNVVVAVPRSGYRQTEESARRSLVLLDEIAQAAGHRQSVIVLVDRVQGQDAGSRRVWSSDESTRVRSSLALVCTSALARAIGSFFIGLNRPVTPTRMFASFHAALEWSMQMQEEHGRAV